MQIDIGTPVSFPSSDSGLNGAPKRKLGIFIKTCRKDHDWLKYCLRSIEKYAEGFEGVCIVTDDDHKEIYEYKDIIKKFPVQINLVEVPKNINHRCQDGVGYIWMQNIKLNWHNYCDYDAVLQIDSDCILTNKISPDTYLTANGLWKWWIRKWEMAEHAIVHKYPLERLLQRPTEHEHMLFNGWILDRNATKGFHSWIKKAHGCDWWTYILEKANEDWGVTKDSENWLKVSGGLFSGSTRGSSVYNAFGAYVEYVYEDARNTYKLLEGYIEVPPIKQFWSWGGLKEEIINEIEQCLGRDERI